MGLANLLNPPRRHFRVVHFLRTSPCDPLDQRSATGGVRSEVIAWLIGPKVWRSTLKYCTIHLAKVSEQHFMRNEKHHAMETNILQSFVNVELTEAQDEGAYTLDLILHSPRYLTLICLENQNITPRKITFQCVIESSWKHFGHSVLWGGMDVVVNLTRFSNSILSKIGSTLVLQSFNRSIPPVHSYIHQHLLSYAQTRLFPGIFPVSTSSSKTHF